MANVQPTTAAPTNTSKDVDAMDLSDDPTMTTDDTAAAIYTLPAEALERINDTFATYTFFLFSLVH